jgi:two-component system, NtrC family, nitrogen regulation sensor histidine kinase NtrY
MRDMVFTFQIVIRIFLIAVLALASGWLIHSERPLWMVIVSVIGAFAVAGSLLSYVRRVNRQVRYFFESIRNEDFTLRLPHSPGDPVIRELYNQMEEVNRMVQQVHIQARQMEQYFQGMIEHAATGIFSFNPEGFVVHANAAFRRMIGREVFTHIRQLEQADPGLYRTVSEIRPSEHRLVTVQTERGSAQLSIRAVSFHNQQHEIMLLAVQDIHQVLDEKELDSWLKLIRVLTHEIMNSVAPVISLADSLSGYFKKGDNPVEPSQLDEKAILNTIRGLEIIREQGRGLTSFVESYRKLTRLPSPQIRKVNLNELAGDCLMLAKAMENTGHIQFALKCPDEPIFWQADENLLKQVIINLIRNSVQALENRDNAKIELSINQEAGSKGEIGVKDNGPGISPEIIEQIFVPFFTTRENGSGIGLSLSRQIMRMHGGSLTVHSVADKETIFRIRF